MSKQETLTVMYDKGEWVDGVNIRPYETFKAVMNDELEEKVKKGFLIKGKVTEKVSLRGKKRSKK